MTAAFRVRAWLPVSGFDAEKRHHGLQLAAAVVIAYAVSALLQLPEHLWAVMTTLIVMRPNAGGTWDAGWDRARGTLFGAIAGLAGVYLEHHGAPPLAVLLLMVAGISFASAASPALRSAPVAALIILGAGALAGHSPFQVAALRVAQIALGVAVAMAVALTTSRYRAGDRLRQGCAKLLRRIAQRVEQAPAAAAAEPDEAAAERAAATLRGTADRLRALAASADRETRLFRRPDGAEGRRFHHRLAGLTGRIVQDATMLNRTLRAIDRPDDPLALQAAEAASAALASVADALAGTGPARFDALSQLTAGRLRSALGDAASRRSAVLLTAPLSLLQADLQRLGTLVGQLPDNQPDRG